MGIIFHIANLSAYEQAKDVGQYVHPSLNKEGFIHCSQHYQVCEVANFIFKGQKNLILLAIDEMKCHHDIKYEGPSWNTFPHIYGALNLEAIVSTFNFNDSSIGFQLPSGALEFAVQALSENSTGPLYKVAQHYDAMNGSSGSDVDFYVQLAKEVNGSVLDLACGSGRFSIPIAASGLSVSGLDLSGSMLNLAKQKSSQLDLKIDFKIGDIRLFDFEKKYDFIFCGFNSSQHLHEEKEFRSFLECVQNHLNPDGIFAFDIYNPSVAMLNRSPKERFLVSNYLDPEDSKEISVWEYPTYDSAKQLSSYRFVYEKSGSTMFEENFSLRSYFPLEMDIILRNSKFEVLNKFGSFSKESFNSNSMKQIFVCKLTNASS